jgi:hypothetical protein
MRVVVVGLAVTLSAACGGKAASSDTNTSDTNTVTADAATADAATVDAATLICPLSLASFGAECPPTFDGTAAQLPACKPGNSYEAGTCGKLVFYRTGGASVIYYAGFNCYYDPRSHALVGASRFTDELTPCSDASSWGEAGVQPTTSNCAVSATQACL